MILCFICVLLGITHSLFMYFILGSEAALIFYLQVASSFGKGKGFG